MNNDLAYTMIAGMNAAAGQGTEALGNLTRFLDTDKTRVRHCLGLITRMEAPLELGSNSENCCAG